MQLYKKLETAGIEVTASVQKCKSGDGKPGRPWCVYKHGTTKQPKGWPKTYETEDDAKYGLKMMHTFRGK